MLFRIFKCVFGPKIRRIHRSGKATNRGGYDYTPNSVEYCADLTLRAVNFFWNFTFYTSPFWIAYMFKNQYFTIGGVPFLVKYGNFVLCVVISAMWIRGVGRYANPEYEKFLKILTEAKTSNNPMKKCKIRDYDFQFKHWPVDFKASETQSSAAAPQGLSLENIHAQLLSSRSPGLVSKILGLPCELISYCTMHTFGRWLIYPGHTELLNQLVASTIEENRDKMVEMLGGMRAKLEAKDGNHIDVMFIDRRKTQTQGQKLVICTEGNAGFYEIGCTATPVDCGYSVLGWNHPGFGCSSVLDATFDDIVPLGLSKMPERLHGFTHRSLRKHMNLNIAEQLIRYPGPIRLIRRTRDEVIITSETPDVAFNRGNDLLIKILQHRYPILMNVESLDILTQYLHAADQISMLSLVNALEISDDECTVILREYADQHSAKFPMMIGENMSQARRSQLVIFLASKYMTDFEATHCNPLPVQLFLKPWSLDDNIN